MFPLVCDNCYQKLYHSGRLLFAHCMSGCVKCPKPQLVLYKTPFGEDNGTLVFFLLLATLAIVLVFVQGGEPRLAILGFQFSVFFVMFSALLYSMLHVVVLQKIVMALFSQVLFLPSAMSKGCHVVALLLEMCWLVSMLEWFTHEDLSTHVQ